MTHLTPWKTRNLLLAALIALVLASAPPALAHPSNNHGTIKVHDDASVEPAMRNQPHVSCEFWIEGFNMADDSGHLEFYRIPPSQNPPVLVLVDNWTGTPDEDGDGFHFLAGPYNLTPGHYRVEAYLDQPHPGAREHFAKAKVFWVNECKPGAEAPPCPPDVEARLSSEGDDVILEWGDVANASEFRIYRAVGNEDFQAIGSVDGDTFTFTDEDRPAGVTHRYFVTAVVDGVESQDCEVIEITPIPFFPGPIGFALAALGTLGAVTLLRRRR